MIRVNIKLFEGDWYEEKVSIQRPNNSIKHLYNFCNLSFSQFWIIVTDFKGINIWGKVLIEEYDRIEFKFRREDCFLNKFPSVINNLSEQHYSKLINRLFYIVDQIKKNKAQYESFILENLPNYMKEGVILGKTLARFYPNEGIYYKEDEIESILRGIRYTTVFPKLNLEVCRDIFSMVYCIINNTTVEAGWKEFTWRFPPESYDYSSIQTFIGVLGFVDHSFDIMYSKVSLLPRYDVYKSGWTFAILSREIDSLFELKNMFKLSTYLPNMFEFSIPRKNSIAEKILRGEETRRIVPWISEGDHKLYIDGSIHMGFPEDPSEEFLNNVKWDSII